MEEVHLTNVPESSEIWTYLRKYVKDDYFAISFVYESSFSNTSKLRMLVENLFDIFQLDPKDKNRLVLVSDELNNNAVEHGTGEWWENKTSILIEKKKEGLNVKIEVTDSGSGEAEKMEKLKREKDAIGFEKHHGIRGRGLFLITEKIADKLYFKNADWWGLTVWIEKKL